MPRPHTPDLVVLGDCNPDLIMRGNVRPRFGQAETLVGSASLAVGGSATITACGAARLGVATALIAAVGDDVLGRAQLDAAASVGVDVGSVAVREATASGLSVVLSEGDDRAILTFLGATAGLAAADVDEDLIAAAAHLHVSSLFLLDGLRADLPGILSRARQAGTTVSLDTNFDPSGAWSQALRPLLAHVDLLLPNETEARMLTGAGEADAACLALAEQVATVAVKLGTEGAVAARGGELAFVAAPSVAVLDSTGAGDSFDAGFIAATLAGEPLAEALRLAVACGSLAVCADGGTAGQPTMTAARELALTLDRRDA